MNILNYPDASKVPEAYLKKLVLPQIQCWGSEPHGEYKICDDDTCRRIIGIEEIHTDTKKPSLHSDHSDSFSCPECQASTSYFYEPQEYLSAIQEYVLTGVSAVLLCNDDDEIEGFAVMSHTNLKSAVENEFATRPGSYDPEELSREFSNSLFGDYESTHEEVCVFHQMYISPAVRNATVSFKILVELFYQGEHMSHLPVINETKYSTNYYPIMRSLGFQNILHDRYGYVSQYISSYQGVLDFLETHKRGYRTFTEDIRKYRQESQDVLKQSPEFCEKHFYLP